MISAIFHKIFGSRNDRLIKGYRKRIEEINSFEPECKKLSDGELAQKTQEFKKRIASGSSLDEILPEAFAVAREASVRVMNMRHFDVQLIGAMALHEGKIAEMGTGEGKTLVATLAVYLNALSGKGVHVVTVNDYLAARDAEWMGSLYQALGLTVGINLPTLSHEEKKMAYQADITYGTNNEFGFDYLRDNMVYETDMRVQRLLNYAVVDEVDSILIDEARTPLIISGHADDQTELYVKLNMLPTHLDKQIGEDRFDGKGVEKEGDYTVDEKSRQIYLTERGHEKVEKILADWQLIRSGKNLYASQNIALMHHVYAALRAHVLYFRNQHYVVQNDEVIIVDEFTGRMMPGRRWSDGLHQAVEAKENVRVQAENQTLASITFQNYFRLYDKLSGMTGTADTEAYEFKQIYNLETVIVPPNKSSKRVDFQDQVFKTSKGRYRAVIKEIRKSYDKGQPVLVGTTSIDNSELLSSLLLKEQIPHQVLNAKQHENEAVIIAQAGRPKMITIATNMAGRGTDIVLGGNVKQQASLILNDRLLSEEDKEKKIKQLHDEWQNLHDFVTKQGGLHIIGTERHESRRIDNQLRGRAGRQGDPGSSRFFLSLEDPLLRIFSGDRVRAIMDRFNLSEDEPIEAGLLTRRIEAAQKKVEARNFEIRKQLLEYDDVANDQRKVFYHQRTQLLESTDISMTIIEMLHSVIADLVKNYVSFDKVVNQLDLQTLQAILQRDYGVICKFMDDNKKLPAEYYLKQVIHAAQAAYDKKVASVGKADFCVFERSVMLQTLDIRWREHLAALDYLRQGIHFRGYAQKNPKQEYKKEAFELFEQTLNSVKEDVVRVIMTAEFQSSDGFDVQHESDELISIIQLHEKASKDEAFSSDISNLNEKNRFNLNSFYNERREKEELNSDSRPLIKVGRNELCPCNSGRKYKHCHGKLG